MQTQQTRALQAHDIGFIGSTSFTNTDLMELFTSPTAPVDPLPVASFTRPTYTGYSGLTLADAWLSGIDGSGNGITKNDPGLQFKVTATGPAQVCYGWFITSSDGMTLKAFAFFDAPIAMTNVGDTIIVNPFVYALFLADGDVEFIAGS